jgi:hypothetical protein
MRRPVLIVTNTTEVDDGCDSNRDSNLELGNTENDSKMQPLASGNGDLTPATNPHIISINWPGTSVSRSNQ